MKNILFVCLGNSCRSQMAEAFARHSGAGMVNVASAGLAATHSIAKETVAVMREKGIDLSAQFPKDFEPGMALRHDVVVNMSGYELPPVEGPEIVEWDIPDPNGADLGVHRQVRALVEEHVLDLLSELRESGSISRRSDVLVGQRIAPTPPRTPRLWQRFTRLF